jgi:hypothetical protein
VTEVAELARPHGAVVAMAQCFGTAGRVALAPVADWLRHDAVQSAGATPDPAWRTEVGRLIPAGAYDNLQSCNQETLAFITFCLGLADDAQLLVAATIREDNLVQDAEVAGWIVRMRATGLLTEASLGPLEAAEVAHLAEAISGQRLPETDADLLLASSSVFDTRPMTC